MLVKRLLGCLPTDPKPQEAESEGVTGGYLKMLTGIEGSRKMPVSSVGGTEDLDGSKKSFKWKKQRSGGWGSGGKDSLCPSALFSYLHFSKVFLKFISFSFLWNTFLFFFFFLLPESWGFLHNI